MITPQNTYPFKSLSIPDAQRIWQLAEEDHERRAATRDRSDTVEASPLLEAVRGLSRPAYRELITLTCLGQNHDTSFDCKRAQAEAELSQDYIGLGCPQLHAYLRRALGSFGVAPLHQPKQENYAAETEPSLVAAMMAIKRPEAGVALPTPA
jgi:hypothetical protein